MNEHRNHVVHGYWFFNITLADEQGRSDVAFRPRRWKTGLQGKRYTTPDLDALTERYRQLTRDLDRWTTEAWPDESDSTAG